METKEKSKSSKNFGLIIIGLAVLAMVAINLTAGTASVKWLESIDAAKEKAKENKNPVLLYFMTGSGKDADQCERMSYSTFGQVDIARYVNKHYNPVIIDASKEQKLKLKYNVKQLPSMVLIMPGSDGNILLEGYISSKEFMSRITGAMKTLSGK